MNALRLMLRKAAERNTVVLCTACGEITDPPIALPGGYYCAGRCAFQRAINVLCTVPVAESDRRMVKEAILTMRAVRRARRN